MHGGEKVFALRVDAHAQLLAFATQSLLQIGSALACASRVGDDHHGKLTLHDRLIDVDDTAGRFRQNLRNTSDDSRVVETEDRDNHTFGGAAGGSVGCSGT